MLPLDARNSSRIARPDPKPACQAVESWMAGLEASEFRPLLAVLFERYVETTLEHCRRNFKAVVPLPAVSQAMTVCHILESLLPKARRR